MLLSLIRVVLIGCLVWLLTLSVASATDILIINNDGADEGLNDTTPVAAVEGNPATTLGEQYFNVFQAAADYWEERIDSSVTIRATAQLDSLTCDAFSAVLGSAGSTYAIINFLNAPLSDTIYTAAHANSLAGYDLDTSADDIAMSFNSRIGAADCLSGITWWLGINSPAPAGTISFYDTILHELAHGLGFLTFVNQSGSRFFGLNDAYMLNLLDKSTGKAWSDMSDTERAASSINTGNLVWSGTEVTNNGGYLLSGRNGSHVRLYAPSPYRLGSSVSHWDTVLAPDELMEPSATLTSNDCATIAAFKDIGWRTFGELRFTQSEKSGVETIGSIALDVERAFACGWTEQGAVSVTISSSDGSALSGSDYTAVNQVLSWGAGETGVKTVNIAIFDDGFNEPGGETFTVNLSNPTGGATLGRINSAMITIQDAFIDDEPDDGICFPIKSSSGKVAVICL